jgi:hypothetical protein
MIGLSKRRAVCSLHLSEKTLTCMVTGELSLVRRFLAKRHLNRCSSCGPRYERRFCVVSDIVAYRRSMMNRLEPMDSEGRDRFISRLDMLLEESRTRPWWKRFPARLEIRSSVSSVPALLGVLVLMIAVITLSPNFRGSLPIVSAAEFLNRAVVSDHRTAGTNDSKTTCRHVLIKTTHAIIDHARYCDFRSRQPIPTKLRSEDANLAERLARAGVNWDDPLSAVSFKTWHDKQSGPKDEIRSSGSGLLTLRTSLSPADSPEIVGESLTVREENFHPIRRIVEDRKLGTIEISEGSPNFFVAEKADPVTFEETPSTSEMVTPEVARTELPSSVQLNETELEARLTLDRMNADTGEQIEITRDAKEVRVKGLVESEDRKKELKQSLQGLPFLAVAIRSLDDFKSDPSSTPETTAGNQQSAHSQASPLEDYFVRQGRSRVDMSRISAALFSCALAIGRSSQLIEQIALRFSSDEHLSHAAIHARDILLSRVIARLLEDLNKQRNLLDETGIAIDLSVPNFEDPIPDRIDLVRLAQRNAVATTELISNTGESSRSEQSIAAELAETISKLRTAGLAISPQP